jgi:signal transduction histidine kinase/serine phosphatase RsbU (regulator of sigma subunit)
MSDPDPLAIASADGADVKRLFQNSGQIGADLAKVNWAATPLGDPASWPQSLRTVLQILLTSRFSMWMAWGEELTFICNEKYRRDTLGAKYPWALGRPAREVWAEIWEDISPRLETVMSKGIASWDESLMLVLERSGFKEETYHTFSYSPLTDEEGAIAGMLCVVTEETDRVVSESRLAMLQHLGSALTQARSEHELFEVAAQELAADLRVLPFSLVYLFDNEDGSARLVAAAGVPAGHPLAGEVVEDGQPWPLKELRQCNAVMVEDLQSLFESIPTGAWPDPPKRAYLVPLTSQGEESSGFLVAALSSYRPNDAEYEGFVTLLANQLAGSLSKARAYEEERQRAETLAELDRAKTAFFTNVSHEFRTPLTLLLGPTADALNDSAHPLPSEQRERLELIERNGERLLRLVNTLLDFSRLEAGSTEPTFEPVDLAAETADIARLFEPAMERAGLELFVDCPPIGEDVYVDREMWVKVVSNLLSNALKFTFEGSVTVRLSKLESEAAVELEVTDTGTGIPAGAQKHLFERFHRVMGARSRSHEGSGIGLALVAELVELHKGSVTAKSSFGTGSSFYVRLPHGTSHLRDHQLALTGGTAPLTLQAVATGYVQEALNWLQPDHETRAVSQAGGKTRPRVLFADDNPDMRHYVAGLLEPDYEVATVADGEAALEAARTEVPDLVLTDVMMPKLDGFGLVKELRDDPRTAKVPIIVLSARAGSEAAVEGLDAGADDYLIKPFSATELLARIRSSLQLERSRREASRREQQIASELQQSLVPLRHFESDSLEISAYYQAGVSGTQVGGDWYDVIDLGLGRTALVIGDVMGRGIKAAAVMGQLRAAVRAYAGMDLAPADLLEAMDKMVRELAGGQIVTCFYGVFDPATRSLEFANAGHLPPLIATGGAGACRLDDMLSAPLGAGPSAIRQGRAQLDSGDLVVLYTDGLVELRDGDTDERIDLALDLIAENRLGAPDLPDALVAALCPDGSDDDIAILAAQVPKASSAWKERVLAVPDDERSPGMARAAVGGALQSWGVPEASVDDVVLLTSELVTNAVRHGRPPIELRLRLASSEIFLEVMDGAGYLPRNLHAGPADDHGRGLRILNMVARRSGFRLTEGGKCVWCTVAVDRVSPT